jgi:hypothetical protein
MIHARSWLVSTRRRRLRHEKTAARQILVFGSEPGDPSYTPLWHEVMVTWKGTMMHTYIVLNCPIVHPTEASLSGKS